MSTSTAIATIQPGLQQLSTAAKNVAQGTPQSAASKAVAPAAPSPGRFQHPAITRIAKARSKETITPTQIQVATVNTIMLFASFPTSRILYVTVDWIVQNAGLETIWLDSFRIISLVRVLLFLNILLAVRPQRFLREEPDPAEDIPLTPSQRALLGLRPSSSSARKVEGSIITPPRYRRSSPSVGTPQSGGSARSISANYSASPLSTSRYTVGFSPTPQQGSATPGRRSSGSQFSQSPLFKKSLPNTSSIGDIASNADFSESTRSLLAGNVSTSSFNSTLRRSQSMRERLGRQQEPGTPSPGAKERNKIKLQPGLNYKWLYEKGLKVGPNGNLEHS